jgi:hypothetical protein
VSIRLNHNWWTFRFSHPVTIIIIMAWNGDAAPTLAGDEWVCLISEDNFRFVLR